MVSRAGWGDMGVTLFLVSRFTIGSWRRELCHQSPCHARPRLLPVLFSKLWVMHQLDMLRMHESSAGCLKAPIFR